MLAFGMFITKFAIVLIEKSLKMFLYIYYFEAKLTSTILYRGTPLSCLFDKINKEKVYIKTITNWVGH